MTYSINLGLITMRKPIITSILAILAGHHVYSGYRMHQSQLGPEPTDPTETRLTINKEDIVKHLENDSESSPFLVNNINLNNLFPLLRINNKYLTYETEKLKQGKYAKIKHHFTWGASKITIQGKISGDQFAEPEKCLIRYHMDTDYDTWAKFGRNVDLITAGILGTIAFFVGF